MTVRGTVPTSRSAWCRVLSPVSPSPHTPSHMHAHTSSHAHTHTSSHMHTHVLPCTHTHVLSHARTHVLSCTYTHVLSYVRTHTYTHVYRNTLVSRDPCRPLVRDWVMGLGVSSRRRSPSDLRLETLPPPGGLSPLSPAPWFHPTVLHYRESVLYWDPVLGLVPGRGEDGGGMDRVGKSLRVRGVPSR